jgi:hypothetical protein
VSSWSLGFFGRPLIEAKDQSDPGPDRSANRFAERWSYVGGSSQRRLPFLLASSGRLICSFTTAYTASATRVFEIDRAGASLRPGGAVVVDDIDVNEGSVRSATPFPAFRP